MCGDTIKEDTRCPATQQSATTAYHVFHRSYLTEFFQTQGRANGYTNPSDTGRYHLPGHPVHTQPDDEQSMCFHMQRCYQHDFFSTTVHSTYPAVRQCDRWAIHSLPSDYHQSRNRLCKCNSREG